MRTIQIEHWDISRGASKPQIRLKGQWLADLGFECGRMQAMAVGNRCSN